MTAVVRFSTNQIVPLTQAGTPPFLGSRSEKVRGYSNILMPFYPAAQAQNGWVPALLLWQKYKFVLRITLLTLKTEDAVKRHWRREMKSAVVKRSIIINGHKTSVSLEDAFWKGLREIAVGSGLDDVQSCWLDRF